jgi:hypothetical protein
MTLWDDMIVSASGCALAAGVAAPRLPIADGCPTSFGGGRFGKAIKIGNGWAGARVVGPGDFNHNGHQDLLSIDAAGNLRLYPGTGIGRFGYAFGRSVLIASHWQTITLL